MAAPRWVPWDLVRAVSFPDGASWARLDLPDFEYLPVLAVQAVDGQRAAEAMRQLRALHTAAQPRPTPPDPAPPGNEGGPPEAARSACLMDQRRSGARRRSISEVTMRV